MVGVAISGPGHGLSHPQRENLCQLVCSGFSVRTGGPLGTSLVLVCFSSLGLHMALSMVTVVSWLAAEALSPG